MTTHLSPEQIVEAIDGTIGSAARAHLQTWGECRADVDRARALRQEAETAAPAPEPSPLFWDHFAKRVHQATVALPVTTRPGWQLWWRPAVLVSGAVAVIAMVIATSRVVPPATDAQPLVAIADSVSAADTEGWDFVVSLTEDLPWDDVQQIARPKAGTADAVIDELSPQERAALLKLIKQEMGGLE